MALTPLGIFHTIIGIVALGSAIYLLVVCKHIDFKHRIGKLYCLATLLTAGSALGIFQHGGFNIAHGLAVLTILALLVGILLSMFRILGRLTPYFQLTAFSSTLLFHMIPTTAEVLTRLPFGSPFASSIEDPLVGKAFLIVFVLFLVLLIWQLLWLRKQTIYI